MQRQFPKEVELRDGTRITLRPLVKEDEAQLIRLFRDVSEADIRFLRDNVSDPEVIRTWCSNINYDRVLPIIAVADGEIVADATIHRRPVGPYRDVAKYRVYVRPDFRGRGLALKMLQEAVAAAQSVGLKKLVMEIFADEIDLINAAERHGFQREAILPAYQIVVLSLPLEVPPVAAKVVNIPEAFKAQLPPAELWPERIYTLPELQVLPDKLNVTEMCVDRHVAAGKGERVAILFDEQRITYAQLQGQINRLANSLRDLGIGENDAVFIRAPNIPPMVVSNFAVQKLGAVSVPTSPLFSRKEIAHVARESNSKAIIVSAALLDEVEAARDDLPSVQHIIVIGGDPAELKAKGFLSYAELLKAGKPDLEPVKRNRWDVGVLLFTSGTTGPPKGTVKLVDEAICVCETFGRRGWRVTENDVIGGSAPIAFGAGYCTFAIIPYYFGAACSLTARFEPDTMFETIQKHKITILSILPTAYRKMLQVEGAEKKYDLSTLRVCTGGGESLTAQTYYDWKGKFGIDIYEGFGTTEMMYVFISNVANMRARAGSFGQVIAGYEAKVVDAEFNEVKPGEIGFLVARGPTGTVYWKDPGKQAHAIWNGWNRVGDYVYRDEDGYFWFVSREDDIIKSSGYRIGPEEVEMAIAGHPAVLDVGVIGVPHPVRGQDAKAFVVLKPGYEPTEALAQELMDFGRGKVAIYKLPRQIEFVKELPRTPTGKLLRRILRVREMEKEKPGG